MKFGKKISAQQEAHTDWHYIDYKSLKHHIKDVCEKMEAGKMTEALKANVAFESSLSSEVELVNNCFGAAQAGHLGRVLEILEIARAQRANKNDPVSAQNFRNFVDVMLAIDRLRKFAVWNCVAIVKILKKRQKRTTFGLADICKERVCWLSQQSFFNGSLFAELQSAVQSVSEMLAFSKERQVEDQPVCPMCLEAISDAVELPCKHQCCWKCFVLGPIAFQPGEYRMSHCPVCRSETDATADTGNSVCSKPSPSVSAPFSSLSGGVLTRFLHTYGGQDRPGLELESKQADDEMHDAVSELVKTVLGAEEGEHNEEEDTPCSAEAETCLRQHSAPAVSSSAAAAMAPDDDFFKTLPAKSPKLSAKADPQTKQQLVWLQQALSGDPLAVDDTMFCTLCSELLVVDAVVTTPCKHHFHRVCISRLQMPECPLCTCPLPVSWFLPTGHPFAERGFRVVPPYEYNPAFPGGPSLDTAGFPLHQPPPWKLLCGTGAYMKSYLHVAAPTPSASMPTDAPTGHVTPQSSADDREAADSPRSEASSATTSSSISDTQGSPSAGPKEPSPSIRQSLYGALGPIRQYDAPLGKSPLLPDPFACKEPSGAAEAKETSCTATAEDADNGHRTLSKDPVLQLSKLI